MLSGLGRVITIPFRAIHQATRSMTTALRARFATPHERDEGASVLSTSVQNSNQLPLINRDIQLINHSLPLSDRFQSSVKPLPPYRSPLPSYHSNYNVYKTEASLLNSTSMMKASIGSGASLRQSTYQSVALSIINPVSSTENQNSQAINKAKELGAKPKTTKTAKKTEINPRQRLLEKINESTMKGDINLLSSTNEDDLNRNSGPTREQFEALSRVCTLVRRINRYLPTHSAQAAKLLNTRILGLPLKDWATSDLLQKQFVLVGENWPQYRPLAKHLCQTTIPQLISLLESSYGEMSELQSLSKISTELKVSRQKLEVSNTAAPLTKDLTELKQNIIDIQSSSIFENMIKKTQADFFCGGISTEEYQALAGIASNLLKIKHQYPEHTKVVNKVLLIKTFGSKFETWRDPAKTKRSVEIALIGFSTDVKLGNSYTHFCQVFLPKLNAALSKLPV